MRLYQQFRASIVRAAAAGAGVLLFASGMPVSVFGQASQPRAAQPAALASEIFRNATMCVLPDIGND